MLTIDISSVAYANNCDYASIVLDGIDNTIVSHTPAPLVCSASEFLRLSWAGIFSQGTDGIFYALIRYDSPPQLSQVSDRTLSKV